MKLFADNLESADPVLPVRWCLEPSETAKLKKWRAEYIQILFVIAYEGTDLEDRQLVPIDQMMAYLNFRRPGRHTVFAKIVWPMNDRNFREFASNVLGRYSHSQYKNRVLNFERTDFFEFIPGSLDGFGLEGHVELEVVVPSMHFPKEPPAWLKRLVN